MLLQVCQPLIQGHFLSFASKPDYLLFIIFQPLNSKPSHLGGKRICIGFTNCQLIVDANSQYYEYCKINYKQHMENQEFGIDKNFTNIQSYKMVAEKAKRRNTLFDNYLQILEKIYQHYRQFFEETTQLFKNKQHEKSIYMKEFKSFLRSLTDILKDTSIFQIDCITQSRVNKDETIDDSTYGIVQKLQTYIQPQNEFKHKLKELNDIKNETDKLYSNLKNDSSEAINHFNNKQMMSKKKVISESMNKIQNIEEFLTKGKLQINSNAYDFQKYLLNFKKRLFKNKYNMLKKMIQTSKHSRDSLTEILLFLVGCVTEKLQEYIQLVKHPKVDDLSVSQSKGRKKSVEDQDQIVSSMILSIQQYNIILEELQKILKGLDEGLKRLGKRVKDAIQGNEKVLFENMNHLYEIGENPSTEVTKTFDLFLYFSQKFTSISDKVYIVSKKLYMLKTNVKKHSDVTLSLMRYNNGKNKIYGNDKSSQVDRLYDQISYDYLIDIISEVYHSFKDTLGDMKNYFSQNSYKKKKNNIENSMELSHIQQSFHIPHKKPCKYEIWLWKDWRDKTSYSFQKSKQVFKGMEKFLNTIHEEQEKKEIEKYECSLSSKKDIKGILKVSDTNLQFLSISQSSPNFSLIIPFVEISEVDVRVKIFEKILNIETDKGDIIFSGFLDIQNAKEFIKQKMQSGGTTKKLLPKRVSVTLSSEELSAISQRKLELEKQRQDVSEMIKITSCFVEGVKIEEVYDAIYSDKEFTLRGKPEDCFFSYCMKKAKNYNYIARPYDQPGPQFYTLNKEVSFLNCPKYSTRVMDFDHPLPPIPFMPKSCHCTETAKLYWISNEEFDYLAQSKSSGAPYADTFQVKVFHRVQGKNGGVSVQIYGLLYFVKETGMKSMLKSKGETEMILGGKMTIQEIEKTLKILAGSGTSELKQDSMQESKLKSTGLGDSSNQISKLKNQNKLLIVCLVGVFLLNIIIRFILNI